MRKRICSIMIAVCMVFTTLPATTFAEGGEFPVSESNMEDRDGSLCSHTVHDETCGYIEAVEGADLAQRKGEVPAPVEAPRADETVYNNLGATGNEANITATLSGTTLTVTGTGAMKDWESANDVPWHSAKGTITTVTIGEGITNIGNCAFSGCIALESVNIPASVMEIQYDAFFGCRALENVNFAKDSKLKSIGVGAFQDCEKLASITIPGDVTSIGNSAFRGCTSLTSITIPAKVDMIQISAFSGCSALANVTFEGKTAPRLGGTNVFEGTSTELKIYVPEGATGYSGGNWAGLDDNIVKPETTPSATFTATGVDSGILSGLTAGASYKYTIDNGGNWVDFTGATATILSGINTTNGIQVVKKGNGSNTSDSAVQKITATQATAPTGVGKTDETWAKGDGKITGVSHLMEYKKSADNTYISISGDTVAGLAPGTYHVRVKANGTALASADTEVTIGAFVKGTPTKSDLAYSLTAVNFDGTAKPLAVTAENGKNLGTITVKYGGSTVAPTNAGTYVITVDIAGSAEYNAATLSLGDYVINKIAATAEMKAATGTVKNNGETGATVTLPGKPDGATYGTPVASGTITMTNMSINDSTLTYTAPQSTEGQTGIITIPVTTATNYNNYSITVTITSTAKTPQSISFTDTTVSKTYGDINFTATATQSSGDGAITYASDDTTVATVDANSGEVTIVGQGTATITATAAETDTYAEATATYTLTVSKAPLAITADNKSMTVGGTKPTYTATSTGLVKDETISGVTFTDNATDTNTKGSFSITPAGGTITGGGNGNYTITYVNGTLTINIDVSAIDTALAAADAAKSDVIINEGEPNTVEKGAKFVKAAEMEALASAIQTATDAKLTVTTISESEAAAQALDDAVVTFKAAIKTGTKSSGGGSTGGGGGSTGGGGGFTGGGGSSNPNINVIVTSPSKDKPGDPTQAEIKIDGKVNNKGEATISITDKVITYAFDKALADAKKKGNEANGITVVLRVNTGSKTANSATVNLPKTVQETIINKGILNTIVVVDNPNIKIGMDLKAVKEINKQAKADVSISAMGVDNTKLTGEAQTAIGSRPVFDLAVKYGNGKVVDDFGNSSVAVTIPYTLQDGEKGDNVFAVYVDENGKVEWIEDSQYDANAKELHFTTDHFSTYGVGYKAEAPEVAEVTEPSVVEGLVFTDVTGHWAEKAITFVVERGLLSGVSQTTFGPDISMTRGMFVTVLGRMANADVSEYKASSFADVATDMYYMGYIEWANKNGIAKGSDGNFMPDQPITREQMAVIMQNYANAMGLALPKVHETNMFADNHKISDYAREAVTAMQRAGIISGRDGNVFDPTGTATRAEVSTVLRHYVELVVEIKDNPQAEW